MRKKQALFAGGFVLLWTGLLVLGLAFQKTDEEKQNGLTDVFDVSPEGEIFYVKHEKGVPSLHVFNESTRKQEEIFRFAGDRLITDIDISPDGSTIACISIQEGDVIEYGEIQTKVYTINRTTGKSTLLFEGNQAASSLDFSFDGQSLYYIGLAAERAKSDVFQYDLPSGEQKRLTSLNSYSMSDLHVKPDGSAAYILMQDETVDMFEAKTFVYTVSLDGTSHLAPYTTLEKQGEVSSFALNKKSGEIVYQAIANDETSDLFQYELYRYNEKQEKMQQLTSSESYAGSPLFHPSSGTIYFVTDPLFGKGEPEYHLFKMDEDGTNQTEIILPEQ